MVTRTPVESNTTFDSRIASEDIEASAIPCPLDSCRAPAGSPCKTEDGKERIRHSRRLWMAKKMTEQKA
jgi:hypothetical protein